MNVTNFYGRNTVQSDGYTGALYKVVIYDNATYVTVELKPTKNKSRLNYYSSRNTIIDCGSGVELPIVGFLRNGEMDTQPFSGTWGWDNVKTGKPYHYTMVFAGRIPGGVTNFTLKDKGDYYGGRGFGFSNYTINNPDPCEHTGLTEYRIKTEADEENDGIVGVYEGYNNKKYKLGVIKSGEQYKIVYLDANTRYPWWHVGDVKAILRETATPGFFKADWYMQDKSVESNTYISFDGGSMKVLIEGQDEDGYIKMYPTASSGRASAGKSSEWSGTGFALENGYVVTNFHVVDGAKKIEVHGVNGNASSDYAAEVVATDKNNDLAIIRITDYRFKGFGIIPYAIKIQMVDVGEDVWILGYPLTQYLGNEIKLTNGVVSSRSGFQGDVATYQITAPVQPGNSGGPLFDSNGNIVGVVNACVPGAENVGYAIKTSYLKNLADSYSLASSLPADNSISSLSLKDQVKGVNNYVFMLICSSKAESSYSSSSGSSRTGSSSASSSSSSGVSTSSSKEADEKFADAYTKYSNGDYSGAMESVEESIRLMPSGQAHYLRGGLAMFYLKDATIAKSSFRYCIDNGYMPEESQNMLAEAYSLEGDYEEAIRQFDEFLRLHTKKDKEYISALFGKAHSKSKLGRWSECISDYMKILEYESIIDYYDYSTVYNNIAWAYLHLNQVNKAVEPIKKALKLNHNKAYIWDTDGEVKYKTGNYEECIVSMSNALAIYKAKGDEGIANSYYYRGLAKIKLGNIASGYVDLEKASDLGESKAAEELKKINVSNIDFSDNGSFKNKIERDITSPSAGNDSKIVMIEMTEESTAVYMQYTNTKYDTGGWYSISPDAYIRDKSTGKKYSLLTAQNCAISPSTTPIEKGKTNTFTFIFPALPEGIKKIDLVESEDSTWKFYNIDLQK